MGEKDEDQLRDAGCSDFGLSRRKLTSTFPSPQSIKAFVAKFCVYKENNCLVRSISTAVLCSKMVFAGRLIEASKGVPCYILNEQPVPPKFLFMSINVCVESTFVEVLVFV